MATPATVSDALPKLEMYIDGEFVDSASGEYFESYDPFTAKPWCLVPRGNAADADRAVRAAERAFTSGEWPKLNASRRGALLRRLGDLVAENADALGRLEVRDNGKLLSEMGAQLRYAPSFYHYFAGLADKIEGAVIPADKASFNYTLHEPLGVCVAIIPWNSPLLLTAWKLAPALAAGNTVVIKPSEYTSASTLEFIRLVEQAGFPKGVVNVVTGFGPEAGEALVKHELVRKVAFTGSSQTGSHIYSEAAKDIKRVSLELGGKSPNIVFADADMDNAVKGAVAGIFAATGQTCVAGSRLLVQESIHNEFVDRLVQFARTARMGNPDESRHPGRPGHQPAAVRKSPWLHRHRQERRSVETVLGGGKAERPECGDGWFVEPTIFTGVRNDMRIAQEEVFGPVLGVIPFRDEEEAVAIGNDVVFGLAAGIWTENIRRALTMSRRLQAGTVWVNTYRAVSYTTPFGGYKRSGLGRELGQEAIGEYLQTKSVWISTAEEMANPFVVG